MTMQFGGGSGTASFTTAPISGVPTLQLGTGTFGGGAQPDFQGISALGVNMASGYANNLFDFQVAGVSKGKLSSAGSLTLTGGITTNGTIAVGSNAITGAVCIFTANLVTNTPVIARGIASQTADLLSAQDSGPVNQFGVANVGTGASPVWALRVAPVANAASMAQAHAGGASTGKAIQVIDNSGTTIGWLQLLA